MGSTMSDLSKKNNLEEIDHFDRLPDSLLLLIFNSIGDVKALGRCCVVSRRFHSLVPLVDSVVVRVDCVNSDDCSSSSAAPASGRSRPRSSDAGGLDLGFDQNSVLSHHSPTQVLKFFKEIRCLRIELPGGEPGIDNGVLIKWKAEFGPTLDNCVILRASAVITAANSACSSACNVNNDNEAEDDNGNIPESFYAKWTVSSLISASASHYMLQPIIAEHRKLDSLVLTDADGQGVLSMNKDQLEELRVKPLLASASNRTLVPSLKMQLWYASLLELPNGMVLKGATLVAVRPSEQPKEVIGSEGNWVASKLEEPFGTAARMLMKRRTYCLEMNSF
ncbi:F-box protein At5g46170-like isoform X2 [Olea europaea var. sylvestris]|uniref:F-box protein At5g46170-like isoform X2 n=1 Tax=Olea europaea var. sylvestris TaxID=158386 RepID=UPI000C1D0F6E|nr:F-box protein At5g46170-like isoform X2 [Olea europaea var. sylvestris]